MFCLSLVVSRSVVSLYYVYNTMLISKRYAVCYQKADVVLAVVLFFLLQPLAAVAPE